MNPLSRDPRYIYAACRAIKPISHIMITTGFNKLVFKKQQALKLTDSTYKKLFIIKAALEACSNIKKGCGECDNKRLVPELCWLIRGHAPHLVSLTVASKELASLSLVVMYLAAELDEAIYRIWNSLYT